MSYRSLGSDEVTLRNYRPVGRRKGNMTLSAPLAAGVSLAFRSRSEFLAQCVQRIPTVNFADYGTGQIYAQIINGKLTNWNRKIYQFAVHDDDDARASFEMIAAPP